jgi:hypothetical protein
MDATTLEIVMRRAASMSRRGLPRLLGGAALTGAIVVPTAAASKADKKGQKRCKRQRGECIAYVETYCESMIGADICRDLFNPCCDHFAGCKAGLGIECLFSKLLGAGGG